jgi:hypothetical protein
MKDWNWGWGIWLLVLDTIVVLVGISLIAMVAALARDDGRYTNSPLHGWFEHLKSKRGLCCSFADGVSVSDVEWDTKDGHYRVFLDGKWLVVPDDAVVTEPNRSGSAVVWPIVYPLNGKNVAYDIRCFMPGAGG